MARRRVMCYSYENENKNKKSRLTQRWIIQDAVRRIQDLVAEAMGREGMERTTNGPAQLAALIKSESAMWRGVIKAANIRGE